MDLPEEVKRHRAHLAKRGVKTKGSVSEGWGSDAVWRKRKRQKEKNPWREAARKVVQGSKIAGVEKQRRARSGPDPTQGTMAQRAERTRQAAGTDYKEMFGPSVKNILESERRSAAHRKYRAQQSAAREAWMDLPAYRKHKKRREVKTRGTGEGLSRGRGGPESVERGESGDPEARGGSASYRRAGGSAKASRKIRARKTRKDLHRGSAFSYDESKHDTRTNNPELKRFGESKGKSQSTAKKSKAKVYDSITDALSKGYLGQIFSTKASKRLYVITKRKWGSDPEQEVSGRVAKGFSPGTIPSSFSDVKGYAVRTMARHGKQTAKKYQGSKYWKSKKGKD